ncbi:carboxylesterase/lipase family protein [Acidovorax sp. 22279]|uniref:carboxylesterase/lipase family protein n=1 Tax=Acidovorax sp. 22279 TaxID=3453900 RepID=UPI003F82F37C
MTTGTAEPQVTLAHGGQLRGLWEEGVRVFRGMPYAQAPRGALRFAAPLPTLPWSGVRDATAFAPMAPQLARTARAHAPMLGGDDCLAINVWAPTAEPGAHLPIMVWVHGGGFFRGAASEPLYDGAALARRGVVVVSVQYRLGIDGFLHFEGEEHAAPANRGLLDLLMALQWVRDHIHAWGGDAGRATVFGQSAGAGALACLMGMPASRGLFQRAILQSPSVACQTLQEAAAARHAVAVLAGVEPTLAALGAAQQAAVLHAVHRLASEPALRQQHGLGGRNFFPLRPVVDGRVLTAPPLEALAQQWAAQPPDLQVLVGSNAQEMRLYHVPGGAIDRVTEAQVHAFAQDVGLSTSSAEALRHMLPLAQQTPGEWLCALQSDYYYRMPAQRIAALAHRWARSAHGYEFTWPSPQWRGRLGAAHGVELPFVFGNLHTPTGQELTGPTPPAALAEALQQRWVAFARDGNPGWVPYAGAQPPFQHLGETLFCAPHPQPERFALWEGVL